MTEQLTLAKDLMPHERGKLSLAFYYLAHGNTELWDKLPEQLRNTDVGSICREIIETGESGLIQKAGTLLAGPDWYTAMGR